MELIYDRLSRQAFGLAFRILGDGPAAEDVVQETFLTLWRQAHRLDPNRGRLGSFVMTLVHHKAIDALRSRRGMDTRQVPIDVELLEKGSSDVADRILQSLDRDAIRNALNAIPKEQRQPIEMAYFEGLTHVEIAEVLKLPLGTVKSRLRLGLEKMRTAFGVERVDDLRRS